MRMRKTMKDKKRGRHNMNRLVLGSAIAAAIKRCEFICNPAIVRRPRFTIHVRRLSEGPTRSWLVSCSSDEPFADGKENGNCDDRLSGERASSECIAKIHERHGVEERSSTKGSASQHQVLETKTKRSVCTESHGSVSKDKTHERSSRNTQRSTSNKKGSSRFF
jgi:hypothetical protein